MKSIGKKELKDYLHNNDKGMFVLIDVLSEKSFEKNHIPGAHNVPYDGNDDFIEDVNELMGSKEDTVIFYCKNEECPLSEKAAKDMEESGHEKVLDYEGGMEDWFEKNKNSSEKEESNKKKKAKKNESDESSDSKPKKVKDIMSKDVDYIRPENTIKEAAEKMIECNTGSLAIGDGEKLLGFVTDRDITTRAVAKGLDPYITNIDQIMTRKVLYCKEDDSVEEIAENMRVNKILRLVVLDKNKQFTGIVTHSDLSKAVEDKDEELCQKVVELASFKQAA